MSHKRKGHRLRQPWSKVFLVSLCVIFARAAYCQVEYRDPWLGDSLSLPSGWTWNEPKVMPDQKLIMIFKEPGTGQAVRLYVQLLDPPEELMPAAKMNKRLLKQAEAKVRQRTSEGYENYRLRKDSCELKSINGRSALSWVDDYTVAGQHMVEYLTRVRSEKTNALFFARMPAEHLEDFKAQIDPIIETLQIQ
jgi:hypothetical protein